MACPDGMVVCLYLLARTVYRQRLRRRDGKGHSDRCSAIGRGVEGDTAPARLDQCAHDRQAEARAATLVETSRGATIEALEDTIRIFWRHSRTCVTYLYHRAIAISIGRNRDASLGAGVPCRVVDQID